MKRKERRRTGVREEKEKEGIKTVRDTSITDLKVGCASIKTGYKFLSSHLFNFEHNIKKFSGYFVRNLPGKCIISCTVKF